MILFIVCYSGGSWLACPVHLAGGSVDGRTWCGASTEGGSGVSLTMYGGESDSDEHWGGESEGVKESYIP